MKKSLKTFFAAAACGGLMMSGLALGYNGHGRVGLGFGLGAGFTKTKIKQDFVRCTSNRFNRGVCRVPGKILEARVRNKVPHTSCRPNRDWFVQGNRIVVRHGCKATFKVTYVKPIKPRHNRRRNCIRTPYFVSHRH